MGARGTRKPEHQWSTRRLTATRRGPLADDPRGETFDVTLPDGATAVAAFGLRRQSLHASLAADADAVHAAKCWLVARGQRSIALADEDGRDVERGAIVVDELGTRPRGGVRRIVTLAPSNADVVAALDCFDRVLACEDSSEPPEGYGGLERLGPDLSPNLERIAALSPDLVLSSLSVPGMERVVTGLRARGIPQLVLAPRSLADVLDDVTRVALALGVPERGQAVVARMQDEAQALRSMRRSDPARVYLEWWPRPMFTPGADCFSCELIALAGGVNVFGTRPGSSLQIEPAELRAADPDVCFVSWCGVPEDKLDPRNLIERPGLQGLRAAEQGRVFALDERYSGRPGPRMLEASRRMAAAIRHCPTR